MKNFLSYLWPDTKRFSSEINGILEVTYINGKKVNSPVDVRKFSNNESTLKSIGGVQSDGTIFSYQFGN